MEGEPIASDGRRTEFRGEWHLGWALDGRAIEDVLISRPIEYGTTVRFCDPVADAPQIGNRVLRRHGFLGAQ